MTKKNQIYIGAILVILIIIGFVIYNQDKSDTTLKEPGQKVSDTPTTNSKTTSSTKKNTTQTPTQTNPQVVEPNPPQTIPTVASLNGILFKMASYNGKVIPADTRYTMTFDNGKLSAKICNNMSGNFVLDGSLLKVSNFAATAMGCTSPADIMQIESDFASMLTFGAHIYRSGNTLILSRSSGTVMVFTGF